MKHKNLTFVMILLPILLLFTIRVARADTVHVVQTGDSLFRISLTYGVSVDAIVEANKILNPNLIVVGQELIIPGVDGPGNSQPGETETAPSQPTRPPVSGTPVEGGVMHVIQPGDSLFRISLAYGVPVADIVAANNIVNPSLIIAGQELFIPGATADGVTTSPTAPPAVTNPEAPAPQPPASANLFKNGSFEGDWHYYLYNELQIPDGWQVAIDEGPNTLQPGDGGNFARPEIRVITRAQLAEDEWDMFIFDGFKTMKAFKGYAPTIFHFFQDVYLQPGRYRMTLNFFPDLVNSYNNNGVREFNTDPLAGEIRVIHNNANTDWTTVTAGQRNVRVYEFSVTQAGASRLGASFRNRFGIANNGWFLDDWQLERIGN